MICPTTDPITVSALGFPLIGLYFLGIGLSKFAETAGPTLLERRLKELKEIAGDGLVDDEDEEEEEDEERAGA